MSAIRFVISAAVLCAFGAETTLAQSAAVQAGGVLGTTFGEGRRLSDGQFLEDLSPPAARSTFTSLGGGGQTGGGLLDIIAGEEFEVGRSSASLSLAITNSFGPGGFTVLITASAFARYTTSGYQGEIRSTIANFDEQFTTPFGCAIEITGDAPVPYTIVRTGDNFSVTIEGISPGASLANGFITPGLYGINSFASAQASNTAPTQSMDGTWALIVPAPASLLFALPLVFTRRRR